MPYELLLTFGTLVSSATVLIFLAAYVVLKRRHPHKDWVRHQCDAIQAAT